MRFLRDPRVWAPAVFAVCALLLLGSFLYVAAAA
jgi:hypothetical protein